MKKNISLLLLFGCILLLQLTISMNAQVFSEAPVTISEKGERLSNMIYVKFLPGDLIEIPKDKKDVDGNFISNKFSNIRKTFSEFSKNRQFDLPDLKISKALPNAKDDDTLFTDVKTGEIKKLPNLARVFIIKFPKQVDTETITSELSKHKEVEYAHGPVQLVNCAIYPDDQYYANGGQWYLNTINAPNAWGITKGSTDIKIALIETDGVELTHSDLQSKIAGGDNNPAGIIGSHGTNVAGFAGAITNNATTGVASLGWNIKLLTYQPPKIDDDYRTGLAQKIKDAANAGAHVINLSFKTIKTGFTSCSLLKSNVTNSSVLIRYYYYNWDYGLVRDAITYAVGKNAVVVASAGNTQETYDGGGTLPCESIPYPSYPAQYSNVIAVSASQQNNNFVDGWNYGSFIDVNAPGRTDATTGLWSTDRNNSYTNDVGKTSGTSFSSPQVSALAALIKSINNSLTPSHIKTILENTSDKVGQYSYSSGRNDYFGFGRINAYAALKYTVEQYGGTFDQDVTIPAGDTWNLQPGVTLKFNPGCALVVNGTLNALGNSLSKVTFTRSGSSGNWVGIRFNYGSNGSINFADIQYAYYGIYFNASGYSSIGISNSYIQNNNGYGIYLFNSSPRIYNNNHILNNGSYGIYCQYYSSPYIVYNMIKGHTVAGIYSTNYSSPLAALTYGGQGNNVIKENTGHGLYAYYNSSPSFGTSNGGGYNSIYGNTGDEVRAEYNCTVYAQYNYWGSGSTFYQNQSTIYNEYPLGYDPNSGRTNIIDTPNDVAAVQNLNLSVKYGNNNLSSAAVSVGNDDADLNKYMEIFRKEGNTLEGRLALIRIEECYTKTKKGGFEEFVNDEIFSRKDVKDELTVMGLELINHSLLDKGDFKAVIKNLEKIKNGLLLNEHIEKNTLFALGSVYFNLLNDKTQASKYFDELKTKYPKDDLVNGIDRWLNTTGGEPKNGGYIAVAQFGGDTEATEKTNVSVENYPNPFNPSTKISFSIPQKSQIKLRVFDVLGREVANLAEGVYEAGKYEVTFNASNLPSGVYFYNLTTASGSISKKMLLLK